MQHVQAQIEETRANAILALHQAGLNADNQSFQNALAAVDAILKVHGAAMDHVQGMHQRALDMNPVPQPAPVPAPGDSDDGPSPPA